MHACVLSGYGDVRLSDPAHCAYDEYTCHTPEQTHTHTQAKHYTGGVEREKSIGSVAQFFYVIANNINKLTKSATA